MKKFPTVTFAINSIKEEQQRIDSVRKQKLMLDKYGLSYILPNKKILEEYDVKKYLEKQKKLSHSWKEAEEIFFEKLITFFSDQKIEREYICHVTFYGNGGSYQPPNHIFINLKMDLDHVDNMKHEIIHLVLENFIEKYKISHKRKEELIECIGKVL